MRIITKQRDYYDSVQLYGIDKSVTFIRKTKDINEFKLPNIFTTEFNSIQQNYFRREFDYITREYLKLVAHDYLLLFFCGTVYPIFVYQEQVDEFNKRLLYCYTIEAVDTIMERHKKDDYFNKNKHKFYWRIDLKDRNIINQYLDVHINKEEVLKLHHQTETPYLLYSMHGDKLTINPLLKDIEFYTMLDAFRTYQEVYTFISGILGGKSPKTIEISDNIRKEKHGFDKWSFKTMPKIK